MTDPADPTQPEATVPPVPPGPLPPPPPVPPLAAKPDRPADPGWREPPWIPPRARDERPHLFGLIVGIALILIGLWYFAEHTLGIRMPDIAWRTIWPLILIVIGGLILLRSLERRR